MSCVRELPQEYLYLCPVIDGKYKVLFKLGYGRFSKVKMGIQLSTNEQVAIKIMNAKAEEGTEQGYEYRVLDMFLNEVRMCFEAKHRNIVLILDFNVGGVYRTADGKVRRILYYVMRIAQNGELFRILTLTDPFSEKIARYIFRQLVIALRHLHNRRIAHCDLKSENVLIDSKLNLKIADFGYARYHVDSSCNKILYDAHEPVGTVKCNAPELIGQLNVHNEYQADSLDLFACGCLLFEIVMKAQPFRTAETKDDHYSKLTNDKKKFWEIYATKYSPTPDFKDLIEKLLCINPKERLGIESIMKHPWFTQYMASKYEYKKEMSARAKKVMAIVRREQETEIKSCFVREKAKKYLYQFYEFPLRIKREYEERIIELRHMLSLQESSRSDSSSSGAREYFSELSELQLQDAPHLPESEKEGKLP